MTELDKEVDPGYDDDDDNNNNNGIYIAPYVERGCGDWRRIQMIFT